MIIVHPQTITLVSSNVPAGDNQGYMFDEFLSTQTENADLIEVEIEFNNCDRVALFNLDAQSVDLELTDDDTATVVQTKTIDLSLSGGEYREYIVEDLYIYADATLKISIHNLGADAKCGVCAIGTSVSIGTTLYGVRSGYVDYSIKDTNAFGQTYLNPGNWAKAPEIRTKIDRDAVDATYEDLIDARGTFVIIEANEGATDYEALRIYGFIEDWRITIDNPTTAWVSLSIKGGV